MRNPYEHLPQRCTNSVCVIYGRECVYWCIICIWPWAYIYLEWTKNVLIWNGQWTSYGIFIYSHSMSTAYVQPKRYKNVRCRLKKQIINKEIFYLVIPYRASFPFPSSFIGLLVSAYWIPHGRLPIGFPFGIPHDNIMGWRLLDISPSLLAILTIFEWNYRSIYEFHLSVGATHKKWRRSYGLTLGRWSWKEKKSFLIQFIHIGPFSLLIGQFFLSLSFIIYYKRKTL